MQTNRLFYTFIIYSTFITPVQPTNLFTLQKFFLNHLYYLWKTSNFAHNIGFKEGKF